MKNLKKILIIFISLFYFNSSLYASELVVTTSTVGTFSIVKKGNIVPYDGVLFDPLATATILADKETLNDQYELKLKFQMEKQKIEYNLQIDSLKLSLEFKDKTYNQIIDLKNKQIEELSSNNPLLLIGGGFLGGVILTILTVWVSKK